VEEIAEVDGFGRVLAAEVHGFFRRPEIDADESGSAAVTEPEEEHQEP
jgi:hypothetical protein